MWNSLCESEWNHMTQMHAIATRSSPSIQVERFPLFIPVQDFIKIPKSHPINLIFRMDELKEHTDVRRTSLSSTLYAVSVLWASQIARGEQHPLSVYRTDLRACRSRSLVVFHLSIQILGHPKVWRLVRAHQTKQVWSQVLPSLIQQMEQAGWVWWKIQVRFCEIYIDNMSLTAINDSDLPRQRCLTQRLCDTFNGDWSSRVLR